MTCFQGVPVSTENSPPNLYATSRTFATTSLSSISEIITTSAPRALAVRQTWVVKRLSRGILWLIRRMTIIAIRLLREESGSNIKLGRRLRLGVEGLL